MEACRHGGLTGEAPGRLRRSGGEGVGAGRIGEVGCLPSACSRVVGRSRAAAALVPAEAEWWLKTNTASPATIHPSEGVIGFLGF